MAVQRLHVSIPDAVTNFGAQATPKGEKGGVTLTKTGQFYWTQLLSAELREAIATALTLEPPTGNPAIAASYFNWILSVVDQWPHDQAEYWAGEIRRVLSVNERLMPTTLPTNATVKRIRSFLRPAPMAGKDAMAKGKAMYYLLWNQTNASNSVAGINRFASLPSLEAIWTWENQACGYTGSMVTDRFVRAGGAKAVNPDAKRRKSTATWAKFASAGTRDMCPDGAGMRRGDLLTQRGVGAAVPRMKKALDDGWVLHARVLSGIDYGHGDNIKAGCTAKPTNLPAPPEEHSIMIIGYDGNEFAFWDPDSVSSHRHGAGFGSLFFDPANDRLSTAANDAELPTDVNGNHATGEHRYQVIHVGSQ